MFACKRGAGCADPDSNGLETGIARLTKIVKPIERITTNQSSGVKLTCAPCPRLKTNPPFTT